MPERDPISGAPVPKPMQPFVDALGLADAVLLCYQLGFSRVNVPVEADSGCELVRLAGIETAKKLSAVMAGERVYIPFCRRFLIRYLKARGNTVPGMARKLKCSEDYVYKTLRAGPARAEAVAD